MITKTPTSHRPRHGAFHATRMPDRTHAPILLPRTRRHWPNSAPACAPRQAAISPKFLYDALGSQAVRGHLRAARILPDPHRSGHLRAPRRRHRARDRPRLHADRPRRRQLRQGGRAVPAAASGASTWRSTSRATSCTSRWRSLRQRFPHIEMTALGHGFFAPARAARHGAARRAACSSIRVRRSAISRRTRRAPSCAARAPQCGADGGLLIGIDLVKDERPCWTPPTTTRWASPPPST